MLELTILIFIVTVAFVFLWWIASSSDVPATEEFSNYLQSCPSGLSSFYNTDGDMICCDGEIIARKCAGNRQCILNGNGTNGLPNCVDLLKEEYNNKANNSCPASMPSYFEDNAKKTKGCTNGTLNQTMTGPKSSSQPTCIMYSDLNSNLQSIDSCHNQKSMDKAPCFGKTCSKRLIQPNKKAPPLVAVEFSDDMGITHIAYTRESFMNYLTVTQPTWKEKGIDLQKNIMVAEVAKAVYIDKTMTPAQIQF